MNENIDLTKILDGCPEGTEFYHAGYGRVARFIGINLDSDYPIIFSIHNNPRYRYANVAVTKKGAISKLCEGECLLFPSKDQRDWSKFERFWDKPKIEKFDPRTLQPFDKVLVRDTNTSNWYVDFFSDFNNQGEFICIGGCHWAMGIPYNEDTKHLVGTTKYCPEYYKWWN